MAKRPHNEISHSRKVEILGTLIGWMMRIWAVTLRYEIDDRCGITRPVNQYKPVIFALWHNRIFVLPPIWWKTGGNMRKAVVLTSASHDGAMLASAMAVFGLGAVRGSSSRRAVAALVAMKRALKKGLDVCITPDGPRGPRYELHPGVVKLAQTAAVPIVPIHAQFSNCLRLKTWDEFVLPMPFSNVKITFDEMLVVSADTDDAGFARECARVETVLLGGVRDFKTTEIL